MRVLGLLLVFAAVLGESCFALLNKRIATPIAPLVVATVLSVISLLLAAPPGLAAFWRDPAMLHETPALAAMVYYGLVPTVAGFWLWYKGAALTSGAEAAAFTAVAPLTAMLLARAVLGEAMRMTHVVGMVLVLAAIAVTVSATRES
jgi:drug/metabolite transporter (DMT)-like permease